MTIKGLTNLNRKFAQLPIAQKRHIHNALLKNAQELTSLQRRLVPIRKSGRGGGLRRSIKHRFLDPLKMEISAGDKKKGGVFYVRFVEFGTRPGKRGRRLTIGGRKRQQYRNHLGTKAQPFFYPAYRSLRRRLRSRLTRATTKAAREVAART